MVAENPSLLLSLLLLLLLLPQSSLGFRIHSFLPFPKSSTSSLNAFPPAIEQRLANIKRSHDSLTERLGDPDVLADPSLLMKIMSDRSTNTLLVENFLQYQKLGVELSEANEMLGEADDEEMRAMFRQEQKSLKSQLETLEVDINVLLLPKVSERPSEASSNSNTATATRIHFLPRPHPHLPLLDLHYSTHWLASLKDPLDDRNVMLEIRAGTGGSEANIFAGDLYSVYKQYCQKEVSERIEGKRSEQALWQKSTKLTILATNKPKLN